MLRITKIPQEEPKSNLYRVKLNEKNAELNFARVSAMPYNTVWPGMQRPINQTEEAAFLHFCADEKVTVEATAAFDFSEVTIRPLSRGVKASVSGKAITFTLHESGVYTVEADGTHRSLTIFFDPPAEPVPNGARYFGPGVHHPGKIELCDGESVYLDQDAVVYGSIFSFGTKNVRILGNGILDGKDEARFDDTDLLPYSYTAPMPKDRAAFEKRLAKQKCLDGLIRLYYVTGAIVRGVILRDCVTFCLLPAGSKNLWIENVKTIGMWRYNSDGIDLFNCSNVTVKNCFLRNFDDCMVIKGIRGWDTENNENILVTGCVIWCDWGSALEVGAETNAPEYRNIIFENCDIIHASFVYMRLHHFNNAYIHQVLYRDIRCEFSRFTTPSVYQADMTLPYTEENALGVPKLIDNVIVRDTAFSDVDTKGKISDILYENIQILSDAGLPLPPITLTGLDSEHDVRRIQIRGVFCNGKKLTADDFEKMNNNFADEPEFK